MKKIFIIAGEASGDYIGGKLIDDVKSVYKERLGSKNKLEFVGIGGSCMKNAGLSPIFSIDELSIIGIWEVLGKIFRIKKLIDKTVESIFDQKPDVLVTIDSSGFTHRVDRAVKIRLKKSFHEKSSVTNISNVWKLPIVHYVAPPIWAWRGWRAKSMHKFIDKLLTLFPFEPELFNKYGLKTIFVGHPIVTDNEFEKPNENEINSFLNEFVFCSKTEKNTNKSAKIVTLLPGSRKSEINKHMPVLCGVAELMVKRYGNVKFIIPTIESLRNYLEDKIENWIVKPNVVAQKSQKILAYYSSDVAVAASGTVTLELARTGLPFVAIYKTSFLTALIVKYLIKIRNVCLVNILAKKDVVCELLQENCTSLNIFNHILQLLETNSANLQRKSFTEIMNLLKPSDAKIAAKEILDVTLID
jgi:lipid-A-disaccharide synthase